MDMSKIILGEKIYQNGENKFSIPMIANQISIQGKQNLSLSYHDGFIFTKRPKDINKDTIDIVINSLQRSILEIYLKKQHVFTVNEDFWNVPIDNIKSLQDDQTYICEVIQFIHTHSDEEQVQFQWKIESEHWKLNFIFASLNNVPEKLLSIVLFDQEHEILRTQLLSFNGNKRQIGDPGCGPFFMSKISKYAEKIAKGSSGFIFEGAYLIAIIAKSLRLFIQHINDKKYVQDPNHSTFEMYFYRKIFSQIRDSINPIHMMVNISNYQAVDDQGHKLSMIKSLYDIWDSGNIPPYSDTEPFPLIDLNVKEWRFIDNYISKHYIDGNKVLSLFDIFNNSRYGNSILFPIDGSTSPLLITIYSDIHEAIITIQCKMECYTVASTISLGNVTDFHPMKDLTELITHIALKDIRKIPSGYMEIANQVPEIFNDKTKMIDLCYDIIKLYTIIHDRPDRTRVIRETITMYSDQKNHRRTDKNYTIRRILKSTKDAKEYIVKMTSESHIDREYIMESWERIGHYRRLPNSDKKIWIDKTTCKRRLTLSEGEKEVHLKL